MIGPILKTTMEVRLILQLLSLKAEWRTRQTLWEECTDANPKLSLNDT